MAVAADSLAARYAAVRQVMTGFGRIASSASAVIGLPSIARLQELIAARPRAGLLARGSGLSYGDAALNRDGLVVKLGRQAFESMYCKLPDWRAVRARLDPRGVFQSDLGRRLGLC